MLRSPPDGHQITARVVFGSSGLPRRSRGVRFGLLPPILATGIAAVLRFWHLGHNSLWADEFASLLTALPALGDIPSAALRNDAFEPPLYFWLLHGILQVAGHSEWALRLVSAVAGSLTVPIVWLLIRDLSRSAPIASTAALLLATNPLHIWYSQEARPYALMVLLGTTALLCLARALDTASKPWWLGFTVLSALAILVHVTAAAYLLIAGAWALRARGIGVLSRLTVATTGTFLLTLPFLVMLHSAVQHATGTGGAQRPLTGLELPYTIFTFVAGYSFGPPVRQIQDLGWQSALLHNPLQTALVGVVLVWLTALILRVRAPGIFPLAVLLLVPLVATVLGSMITTKAYNVRYTLPALTGFVGLVAVALERLPLPARRASLGMMVGLFAWADVQWFTIPAYWKEDSRAAARCLSYQLPTGSTVGVAPSYMRGLLAHYAPPQKGFRFVAVTDTDDVRNSRPNALAVTRLYHLAMPESELVRAFQAQGAGRIGMARDVGYRLYFSQGFSSGATESPCHVSELDRR